MREIHFYSICLLLFCSVSATAQGVAFEGLRLDDLIPGPGRYMPGLPEFRLSIQPIPGLKKFRSESLYLPGKLKDFGNGMRFGNSVLTNEVYFRGVPVTTFAERLTLHVNTNKQSNGYRSLNNIYTSSVGMELNYKISRSFELKGGVRYQYNIALKKWEWVCLTGVIFHF